MNSPVTEGSHGRRAGRDDRWSNGTFKYNRQNLSYTEMMQMERRDGDLFAVFRSGLGDLRVEYARLEDYSQVATESMRSASENLGRDLDVRDAVFVVGFTMITRYMDYEPIDFLHLVDHRLEELFDLRDFAFWVESNDTLIRPAAERACLQDPRSEEELLSDYLAPEAA